MRYTLIMLAALACAGSVSAQEPVWENTPPLPRRMFDDWVCYNGTYKKVTVINGFVPQVYERYDRCGNAYTVYDYGKRTRYDSVKKLNRPSIGVEESVSKSYDDDYDYYERRVSDIRRRAEDHDRKMAEIRREIAEIKKQIAELDKKAELRKPKAPRIEELDEDEKTKQKKKDDKIVPMEDKTKKDDKTPKNMKRPSEIEEDK